MLEDSITSSPSKSNKSINPEPIQVRKNEQNKADDILQLNSDHEQIVNLHKIIQHFYYDSYDEYSENEAKNSKFLVAKPSAIIRNYKPFEMERSLAKADRISTYQIKQNKRNSWPSVSTQGFSTCNSLTKLELGREQQSKDISDNYNKNNSFNITESELIICCDNAEKILQCNTSKNIDNANSIAEGLSPKKNCMFSDFSQSSSSKENNRINTSYQNTPEFRLRRQPEKTYSRKYLNTTKTNLNKRFEEQTSAVSGDEHSNFYSLSIPDDLTVGELSNNHDATPTSTNFCDDNLLNLSVNFTQNNQILSDDYQYDHQQYTNLFSDKMSDLYYDFYNSFEEFHGFHSQKDAERAVIDVENDELKSIHTALNIKQDDIVTDISLNEKENATYDGGNDVFAYNNNQKKKQENIVEFAVNISPNNNNNPTVPVNIRQDLTSTNAVGFKTTSSKPNKASREANLADIPAIKKYTDANKCDTGNVSEDVNYFENLDDYDWNDDSDLFQNFQTSITSKGKHETEKLQRDKTNVLQIPEQVQVVPSTSKMAAPGFKTASGKNLNISKKALDSVEKLLKEFESYNKDNYNCEKDLKEIKCRVYAKTHNFKSKQSSLRDIKEMNIENKEKIIDSSIVVHTDKENANYQGWNEDDFNDIVAYINTENILHHPKKKQENVLEFAVNKSPTNNDNSTVPVNVRQDLTSNNLKPIKASREAHIMAANKLSKLPDIPAIEKNAGANNCERRNFIEDVNIFETEEEFEFDLSQNFQTQITSKGKHATLSEWPINPKNSIQQNVSPKPMIGKRKHSVDNSYTATPGANTEVLNRGLYNSASWFAEQSLKSPLTPERYSFTILNEEIPKVNKEKYGFNADEGTAIKSSVSLGARVQTPASPNLREFISNAPLTSTFCKNCASTSPLTIKDTDFKHTTWKNNEAEVSPINSTYHNCRPSGLRRGMLKKTET